jgi:hypothetical protein
MRYRHNEYKVVEKYLDERIEVKVDECWHRGKLVNVEIYCLNSNMLSFFDSNLNLDIVNDLITKEVILAEKLISDKKDIPCFDLSIPRDIYIVKKYGKQMIDIKLVVNLYENTVLMCLPSMDNMLISCERGLIRDKIYKEIKTCKMIINDGGILPVPEFLLEEKGKSFAKKI